ncbi:MAG TPA: GNAT family N-acetyltransferase [Phycisphaerales bacterium]|nr:GNAT family N-acetyltransferase [Phycisphaerales bacterium]
MRTARSSGESTVAATRSERRIDHPPPQADVPAGHSTAPTVVVRRWATTDAVAPITALLHRAYAKQMEMGLRPLAGRQDDAVTLRRLSSGESFVAEWEGAVRGVIILNEQEPDEGPDWFHRARTCSFSQFAVEPLLQSKGIGRALLSAVERRAAELGNDELALSMAEPDHALRDYYLKRGFRVVGTWKWPYTNYTSLIMSRRLNDVRPS